MSNITTWPHFARLLPEPCANCYEVGAIVDPCHLCHSTGQVWDEGLVEIVAEALDSQSISGPNAWSAARAVLSALAAEVSK